MTRRYLLLSTLISVGLVVCRATSAGTATVQIPIPKLSAVQILAIVEPDLKKSGSNTIVGVEWAKAGSFQPRYSDGTQWHALDRAEDYSWFVTYVYRDANIEKALKTDQPIYAVGVIRIMDDGKRGVLVGTRT